MDTKIRTIVKSLTFRIIAFSVTAPFVGVNIAVGLQLFLLFAYYLHERLWLKVKWGKEYPDLYLHRAKNSAAQKF